MKTKIKRNDVAVIVLTRNAGSLWKDWIKGIQQQTIVAGKYLVVDSNSNDGTPELARQAGLEVFSVSEKSFNHGGTRQLAADLCPDAKYLIYLTQDAILKQRDAIEILLQSFEDEKVALAFGRHVPRESANLLEKHARNFTYPEQSSVRDKSHIETLGFKAAFSSDVFAAYRVSALREVGGFPKNVIVSEDSYVSVHLLLAGWKTAYSAQSEVEHSHEYGLLKIFSRYFDVGVFHEAEKSLISSVGEPDSEGWRFLHSEIAFVWKNRKWMLPYSLFQTAVKYYSYKLGSKYHYLPNKLCQLFSAQKAYWNNIPNAEQENWQTSWKGSIDKAVLQSDFSYECSLNEESSKMHVGKSENTVELCVNSGGIGNE